MTTRWIWQDWKLHFDQQSWSFTAADGERLTCILEYRGNALVRITPEALRLPYINGL